MAAVADGGHWGKGSSWPSGQWLMVVMVAAADGGHWGRGSWWPLGEGLIMAIRAAADGGHWGRGRWWPSEGSQRIHCPWDRLPWCRGAHKSRRGTTDRHHGMPVLEACCEERPDLQPQWHQITGLFLEFLPPSPQPSRLSEEKRKGRGRRNRTAHDSWPRFSSGRSLRVIYQKEFPGKWTGERGIRRRKLCKGAPEVDPGLRLFGK